MDKEHATMLSFARAYIKRGWSVFPLHHIVNGRCSCEELHCNSAGKHPRTRYGVKDATTDLQVVCGWWSRWPDANIGIATGTTKGANLYVIDVDMAKGADLAALEPFDFETLSGTLTVRTGSGGFHYYLACTEPLPNTANKLAPFIDTRGEGGYVVAPPSWNKDGQYEWLGKHGEPMPIPPALLTFLKKEAVVTVEQERKLAKVEPLVAGPDGLATLQTEARNMFLISMAGRLRAAGLSAGEIQAALLTINEARYGQGQHPKGPLDREEIKRTIFKSVAKYESLGNVVAALPVVDRLPDIMARVLPDTVWVVPGLLSEGLCLFAGKPKMGKSWLALALALTCAQGTAQYGNKVLGNYAVEPSGVLYLSLEDSPKRFQSRVEKLLQGQAPPEAFGSALQWKPCNAGGLADLETYLTAMPDTRLVIIDTLAKVRPPATKGGSIYQEDYQFMGEMQQLALRHHAAIILVHHLRKECSASDIFDDFSGSTGLTGCADTLLVLKRERNQMEATLSLSGRDVEEQELAITFAPETCTWHFNGNVAERQQSQVHQAILDVLDDEEGMTVKEIAEVMDKPYGTISRQLSQMVKDGFIIKKGYGCYMLKKPELAQTEPLWGEEHKA